MALKAPDDKATNDEPHYAGHRGRLRNRFLTGGPKSLADYEILELLLFSAIPRRDTKPMAKELLAHFGSLAALFRATPDQLAAAGVGEATAALLKVIEAASLELIKTEIKERPVLGNWDKLMDYLNATMAHAPREEFRLLFLNKKNELLADEVQQTGTVDHTPAYPREIMKRALEIGATAMLLVHNHPSGDPTPSAADIELTRSVVMAAQPFNIVVHDHIIIARNGHTSFRAQGLI